MEALPMVHNAAKKEKKNMPNQILKFDRPRLGICMFSFVDFLRSALYFEMNNVPTHSLILEALMLGPPCLDVDP